MPGYPGFGSVPRSRPLHHKLHVELGIPMDRRIPDRVLLGIRNTPVGGVYSMGYMQQIVVTTQLKYQVNFAINAGQGQESGLM